MGWKTGVFIFDALRQEGKIDLELENRQLKYVNIRGKG